MNRFIPDSLLEALLRPLAMAAPNGWVYIEVIAPDFRFLFLGLLGLLSAAMAWKSRGAPAIIWALAGFTAVAFVPWLITTGNGRYFIPVLVLGGILCVAFVHRLPVTRSLRVTLVLVMIAVQGVAVLQNNPWGPWNAWGLFEWRQPPYYPLELDAQAREQPATYVTMSVITYSLVAPLFPKESRWINLSSLAGAEDATPDLVRAQALLRSAERLRIFLPSMPSSSTFDGRPNAAVVKRIGQFLQLHQLAFARGGEGCRLLPMREQTQGLRGADAAEAPERTEPEQPDAAKPYPRAGFWVCEGRYAPQAPVAPDTFPPVDPRYLEALTVLERSCPRLFPAGQKKVVPLPSGVLRHYASADMKVYVFTDGTVYYKYHRALNFVSVGTVDKLLAPGFTMSCDEVPGRSGLPWDRGI
jgi:hypothetical protein